MWLLLCVGVAIQLVLLAGLAYAIHLLVHRTTLNDVARVRAAVVDVAGNLVADVLEHPRVQKTLAESITNGINHTMEQPDLGKRMRNVSEALRDDTLPMARSMGEQLPSLAANFVGGAMSSMTRRRTSSKTSSNTTNKNQKSVAETETTTSGEESFSKLTY